MLSAAALVPYIHWSVSRLTYIPLPYIPLRQSGDWLWSVRRKPYIIKTCARRIPKTNISAGRVYFINQNIPSRFLFTP
ncbi:MAG: hypothetical protein AVDCRST_MAG95-480 [uncultured Adhaeribacter sp.]|uniref:Uncharacterized protein n=1 Tax=uncultured Adhaeribacter sp. TaxID=448109 RepID=A0A6J4HD50_9BACT|nr:MAG: hypothetical protein AVDCRST_MAG95-480 [uncultured Adhaeribacter sp.]